MEGRVGEIARMSSHHCPLPSFYPHPQLLGKQFGLCWTSLTTTPHCREVVCACAMNQHRERGQHLELTICGVTQADSFLETWML